MAFYARDFIFNGTMSQELGLTITSDSAESKTDSGSGVQLIIQKLYRRPRNYLLGVEPAPVLTFPVSFNSESKIEAVFAAKIEQLLFGKTSYQKLQVIQPDLTDYYWNCFLTEPQIKRVGGEIVGWDCVVTCDSPWAYSFPRSIYYPSSLTSYTDAKSNFGITYNNRSGNNDYTYPKLIFTMQGTGGSFTLNNVSDNSRIFQFTGLSPNEVITVDNDLQIITSSTGLSRLGNFNKKWFRLVYGQNSMQIAGRMSRIQIMNTDAQKIGG